MTDIIHTITKNRESWPPKANAALIFMPGGARHIGYARDDDFERYIGGSYILLRDLLPLFEGTKVLVDNEPSEEMIRRGALYVPDQDRSEDTKTDAEYAREIYKAMLEGG